MHRVRYAHVIGRNRRAVYGWARALGSAGTSSSAPITLGLFDARTSTQAITAHPPSGPPHSIDARDRHQPPDLLAVGPDHRLHVHGRPNRALGVVLVDLRRAEEGDQSIAHQAADGEVTLPIARVRRDGTGHFMYDPDYIPPALQIGASEHLLLLTPR